MYFDFNKKYNKKTPYLYNIWFISISFKIFFFPNRNGIAGTRKNIAQVGCHIFHTNPTNKYAIKHISGVAAMILSLTSNFIISPHFYIASADLIAVLSAI